MSKKQEVDAATHKNHQKALLQLLQEFDRVCRILGIPYVLFAGTALGAVRHGGFIPWDDDLDVMMLRGDYDRFLREADTVLDRERFFLQGEFSEHWPMFFSKLRLNGTTCLEKLHPKDSQMHQGVYMDIFPCDNALGSELGRKLQFLSSKIVIAKSLGKRGYETNSIVKKVFMAVCALLPAKPFLALTKAGREECPVVHSFFAAARSYRKNVYPRSWFTQRKEIGFEGGSYPISQEHDALLTMLYGDYMILPPPQERVVKQHAVLVDLEKSFEEYANYRDNLEFDTHTRSIR